jgi:hypothetical protein
VREIGVEVRTGLHTGEKGVPEQRQLFAVEHT